jgi:hypothetical protein
LPNSLQNGNFCASYFKLLLLIATAVFAVPPMPQGRDCKGPREASPEAFIQTILCARDVPQPIGLGSRERERVVISPLAHARSYTRTKPKPDSEYGSMSHEPETSIAPFVPFPGHNCQFRLAGRCIARL